MQKLSFENEKSRIAKLAVKHQHISQVQLDILLSNISDSEELRDLENYANEHIIK